MKRFLQLTLLLFCFLQAVCAQEQLKSNLLRQAEKAYKIGHFKEVADCLEKQNFPADMAAQAFRLLALTWLATDRPEKAREAVYDLLKASPYYTPYLQDPERFIQLIREIREGQQSLVTASRQSEAPEEAPVPVTLITREMIQNIGNRNLKEVLLTYVPGMTDMESVNEVNIAMHGVYTSGQQKILIMINGHRLNCRSTNGAAPDFGISLDKVRQIEVLRGPASSLYGNVALTAVVNIITLTGAELQGAEITVGAGNFGQKFASLLIGKRYLNMDFFSWANIYTAEGEKRMILPGETTGKNPRAGTALIGAFNNLPSYDIGVSFRYERFAMMVNQHYGKRTDPFASVGESTGAVYTYDKYPRPEGRGIGWGVKSTHAELSYSANSGKWETDGNLILDITANNMHSAAGDYEMTPALGKIFPALSQIMNWQEYTAGASLNTRRGYSSGHFSGYLSAGVQAEITNQFNSSGIVFQNFGEAVSFFTPLAEGKESNYSTYLQLKNSFGKHFILNAGMRYDLKIRKDKQCIQAFSPRLALIYVPGKNQSIKLSYARAFVDAPYFYRFNLLPSFKGSPDMQPEHLSSWQCGYSLTTSDGRFHYDINLFYNHLTDFIYRNTKAAKEEVKYINAGKLDMTGMEHTIQYTCKRWSLHGNFSCQLVIRGENYAFRKNEVFFVPSLTTNIVAGYKVIRHKKHLLQLQSDLRIINRQITPNPEKCLPGRCVVNAGVRYQWKELYLSAQCCNLFNKQYYQGESTGLLYPQLSRNFLIKAGWIINIKNK